MPLSTKPIPSHERLIVALDYPSSEQAKGLVRTLDESVSFYKIGLELLMTGDYFDLIDWLQSKNKKIFADLKFYDIPATVGRAVRALSKTDVQFATVHGDTAIMQAAAATKGNLKILAVTVLTSLDDQALLAMGYQDSIQTLVLKRANQAWDAGLDGIIASGLEAGLIRQEIGPVPLIVSPGIRPQGVAAGDQKRTTTVTEAFQMGVDHIVVGRPIRDATDPKLAAQNIQHQIADLFGE